MWPNAKVSVMGSQQLSQVMTTVSRYVPSDTESSIRSLAPFLLLFPFLSFERLFNTPHFGSDPTQHAALAAEIDSQATAYYSTARLWDDGVIRPVDTRDTLGLALGLSYRRSRSASASGSGSGAGGYGESTTWDGAGRGFGVFRM